MKKLITTTIAAAALIASAEIIVHVRTKSGRFYAYSAKTFVRSVSDFGYVTDGLTHMWDSKIPTGFSRPVAYDIRPYSDSVSHLVSTNVAMWKDLIGTNDLNVIAGTAATYFECFADKGLEHKDEHIYGHTFYIGDDVSGAWCNLIPTNECLTIEVCFIPSGNPPPSASFPPTGSEYHIYAANGMANESDFTEFEHGGTGANEWWGNSRYSYVYQIDRQHVIASLNTGIASMQIWQTSSDLGENDVIPATGILSVVSAPMAATVPQQAPWSYLPYFMANISGWNNTYNPRSRPYAFWLNGYTSQNCYARTVSHSYGKAQERTDFSSIGLWNGSSTNYIAYSEDMHYGINTSIHNKISETNAISDVQYGYEIGPVRLLPYFTVGFAYTFTAAQEIKWTPPSHQSWEYVTKYAFPTREDASTTGHARDTSYLSIRCYNRVLTDQERQQNFIADSQRFRFVR